MLHYVNFFNFYSASSVLEYCFSKKRMVGHIPPSMLYTTNNPIVTTPKRDGADVAKKNSFEVIGY